MVGTRYKAMPDNRPVQKKHDLIDTQTFWITMSWARHNKENFC